MTPILRRSYYGHKRLMTRKRHFVSSVIEYAAGAALESSFRKILFFSLLVSSDKPTKKTKYLTLYKQTSYATQALQ